MTELDLILISMTDDELHAFADFQCSKMPVLTSLEEEKEWAWNCLFNGTLDAMCTADSFQTIDGCHVEIDGNCPHGYSSPMELLPL
jgi:hypothetical protein